MQSEKKSRQSDMASPNGETFSEQPQLHLPSVEEVPAERAGAVSPAEETPRARSQWPPAQPAFRRSETASRGQILLLGILAVLLVLSSLGFVIYLTTGQYRAAVHAQSTVDARSTANVRGTAQAYAAATAHVLATTQANIVASATAQSNAVASATAQVDQATATATSLNDRLTQATGGSTALDDPLSDSSGNNGWDQGNPIPGTGCLFTGGSYQASSGQQGYLQPCIARSTNFSNFVYQVQMTITRGAEAGILFRANVAQNQYYIFRIGTNGSFALDLYKSSNNGITLLSGFNAAISSGLNQSNTLAVLADQGTLYLYANQQYMGSVTDSTLTAGAIGVVALDYNLPTQADFSSAQVWKL